MQYERMTKAWLIRELKASEQLRSEEYQKREKAERAFQQLSSLFGEYILATEKLGINSEQLHAAVKNVREELKRSEDAA